MKAKYSVFQMQTRCGGADFTHLATLPAETPLSVVNAVVKKVNAKLKAKNDDFRLVVDPKTMTKASVKMPEGSVGLTYFLTEDKDPSESIVVIAGSVTAEQAQAIVDKDLEQSVVTQKALDTRKKNLAHQRRSEAAKKAWVTIRSKMTAKMTGKAFGKEFDKVFDKTIKALRPRWVAKGFVQPVGRVCREKAPVKK